MFEKAFLLFLFATKNRSQVFCSVAIFLFYLHFIVGLKAVITTFERLYKLDPNDWNAQMAKRYRQLRRTHFNPQRLSERITSLLHLMEQSGAHLREAQRWNNANGLRINIPQEAVLLQDWITRRIAYLDTQYNM